MPPAMGTWDEADVDKRVLPPTAEKFSSRPPQEPALADIPSNLLSDLNGRESGKDSKPATRDVQLHVLQQPQGRATLSSFEPISQQLAIEKGQKKDSLAKVQGTAEAENFPAEENHDDKNYFSATGSLKSGPAYRAAKVDDMTVSKSRRESVTGKAFPSRPRLCKLSEKCWAQMKSLFEKMDKDGCNVVTKEKAHAFFNNFKNVNVEALFNEVDVDNSGAITAEEFIDFWQQVRASGYTEVQIMEEMEQILEGGAWVDWKDNRDTGAKAKLSFPRRPFFCRLSSKAWDKVRELFMKMSHGQPAITEEQANGFFMGAFANVSVRAMFKEVDLLNHGTITAQEFVSFWVQVKGSGYKEAQILEELDLLLDGGSWVDWDDRRST